MKFQSATRWEDLVWMELGINSSDTSRMSRLREKVISATPIIVKNKKQIQTASRWEALVWRDTKG